ncbi:MAG: hypothetical protein LBN10_01015 [Propionibacteriaceae bacterium]|jgi:hypothetical protein|nr:hypothetical protein [Propionibacteriaceae bacterium]
MRGFSGAFIAITGVFYIMLMTNLMIAVTAAPFWFFAVFADVREVWPWAGLTSILLAPALWGTYAVFRSFFLDTSTSAIRTYFRAWWDSWKRLWPVALFFSAYFSLIAADLWVMKQWGYGSLALPVAAMLAIVGLATASVAWIGLAARPDLGRRAVLKASLYLSIRKAGWSLFSVAILVMIACITWVRPAIGLGLVMCPALCVVWSNSRKVFADYLPESELRGAEE